MTQLSAIEPDLPLSRAANYRDGLGVAASVLCAIHCAAMPFVIGFLPLLGLSFLADPAFHQWMVAICLGLALVAFVPGWRRHRRLAPGIIGVVGLSLISFAAFAGPDDCCPDGCTAASSTGSARLTTVAGPDRGPQPESEILPVASTPEPASTCTAGCCPDDSGPTVTAGFGEPAEGDLMRLVWLWMTPIGGLVLVAAHLTNHRLSGACRMSCCPEATAPDSTPDSTVEVPHP